MAFPRLSLKRLIEISAVRFGSVAVLTFLAVFLLLSEALAQEPVEAAFVRGHFSDGSGVWRADDFGWFYYDMDNAQGGEQLHIDLQGRLAEKNHILYSTKTWSRQFEYNPWGSFQAIAFLGKPYLAGYSESYFTEEISSLGRGELRKILIDDKEAHTLSYNSSIPLLDGYTLVLREISRNGDVVNLILLKNNVPVHAAAVSVGDTFTFKIDDIPVILVHVAKAMRSHDSGIAEVEGVFQISDTPDIKFSEDSIVGNLIVTDISDEGVELKNDRSIALTRNSIIPLVDGLMLVVINDEKLVYYPQGGIFDYGVHEIRGPVYTEDSSLPVLSPKTNEIVSHVKARWNYENFSGFYFDPEDKIGRETIEIINMTRRLVLPFEFKIENGLSIGLKGVQYVAWVQPIDFKFQQWGRYNVISFLGEPWFAGYGISTSKEIGHENLLQQSRIGQLLIDSNDIIPFESGKALSLQEGYEIALLSVNGDKAFVQLRKNGVLIDNVVLQSNSTYVYKKNVADVSDLPILAVHVQNVFDDGRNKRVMIDGIFQISDKNYLPVEIGGEFGKLKIIATTPGFVMTANNGYIYLGRNTAVALWPGMNLRVADNDTLRYCLYTMKYVVPKPKPPLVNYPTNISSFDQANFSMIVQAGAIVGVTSEIIDPSGRVCVFKDLTKMGKGSDDLWGYSGLGMHPLWN